ncbi:hypothetical protein C2S53_010222 [Perilla frutescens var. hirtella]|uniref:Uncharacterized protein n=1 Tax=Perilla frutescens var. hirtella TaxID=608512 RepID=A0AAD4ISR7_PERFH|nr:hypothetical protein C2S53_010222 [Perilla frutescens var. hirtella]
MEDRFTELRMARDASDYMKIANIVGGYGQVEFISLGGIFLPDADALHQPPAHDSTGYGRERPRDIWVCEVIPELVREISVPSEQLTMPRCLRWTFRGNKKKMLANVASSYSNEATGVVPPSPRGTRAARRPRKGSQSSWTLRNESDDEIPAVRKDIKPHIQEVVDRAVERLRGPVTRLRAKKLQGYLQCYVGKKLEDVGADFKQSKFVTVLSMEELN